jgi:hypothetical protein
MSYGALLAIALAVNWNHQRMLLLALVIGLGVFAPVPAAHFYLVCALGEALIGLLAYRIAAPASRFVWRVSALLVAFHALGWWFDGYPPASPYHLMVKICEHAELLACIFLSHPLLKRANHA